MRLSNLYFKLSHDEIDIGNNLERATAGNMRSIHRAEVICLAIVNGKVVYEDDNISGDMKWNVSRGTGYQGGAMNSDLTNKDIEDICRELASAFQGNLSWKWDRRFETVLAEFGVDKKENIRAILERHLSVIWDSSNVGNAPDTVRTVESHFGGLWPGQLLFTSDPNRDALIFCTWWPWGDGKEISIRIGPSYRTLADSKRDEKIQLFKGWFGV